jgi:hypothetical protein
MKEQHSFFKNILLNLFTLILLINSSFLFVGRYLSQESNLKINGLEYFEKPDKTARLSIEQPKRNTSRELYLFVCF